MAESPDQRKHPRKSCRIPLKFAREQSDIYGDALVRNISEHGIYVEAHEELRAGAGIRIRLMSTPAPGPANLSGRENVATIIWCTRIETDHGHFYGAGMRLGGTSLNDRAGAAPDGEYHCALCGKKMTGAEVNSIEGCQSLCNICRDYLNDFPQSLRKWFIERFLC